MNPQTDKEHKRIESDYYVEGYATTFDTYDLCEVDGQTIQECFERGAFDDCDMTDVILQYDHDGYVFARNRNGTLGLEVDDRGLFVWADLSRTSKAKSLYEDIAAGNVDKMSIRCRAEGHFEGNTHIVTRVKKVYDVSAVSVPANPTTEIVARKRQEDEALAQKQALEKLTLLLLLNKTHGN